MIDTKQRKAFEAEYAAILASRRNTLFFDDDGDKQVAEQIVGLSIRIHEAVTRAVIAEHEAAKSAPQPVADVDVPEWVKACASDVWTGGTKADYRKKIHAHAESEISRRVAEAEANNDTLRDNSRECRQECVELRQQLAAAQAEVSRLTNRRDALAHATARAETAEAELTKLREEVSRLSRPVEGAMGRHAIDYAKGTPDAVVVLYEDFVIERNAREAAEAERDELREAHRLYSACRWTKDYPKPRVVKYGAVDRDGTGPKDYTFDDPNDAVLAAFRAERAKVVT